MNFADQEALMERLLTTKREVVFLVGAPLTAPIRGSPLGVPDVSGIVSSILDFLRQNQSRSVDALADKLRSAPNPYQMAFKHLSDYRGTDAANAIILKAVLQASIPTVRSAGNEDLDSERCELLENDLDGWYYTPAVDALGHIAARFSTRFGRTLLTTNFDPLIELSIRRAEGRAFSKVLAGDSSLEDVRGAGSYVVHLHGYWYGTDTLHTPLSLGQNRPLLLASLKRLLRRSTVVVMAYGGWDDIFTRALTETSMDPGENPDVLWCFYDRDVEAIQRSKAALLAQLQPAISRHRVTFITGINCHDFLPQFLERLEQESGNTGKGFTSPGKELKRDDVGYIARPQLQDTLLDSFERGQAVQLIGPPKMGKSALLHWLERTVQAARGMPVAFVNARGLEGRSPVDLVLAIGRALARTAEVKQALYEQSAVPDTRAAERAIQLLVPLCLLVDEADALAEKDHGFDKSFFDTLRALGQERKLIWTSASEINLFDLYRNTGLSSAFLNDARPLRVGALSKGEAERWLLEHGVSAPHVGFGVELTGGVPPALEWMSERLSAGLGNLSDLERGFCQWVQPLFTLWWQRLTPSGCALLKRCAGEGLRVEELEGFERRRARALVEDGFLLEEDGRFRLRGRAWHDFVRDAE